MSKKSVQSKKSPVAFYALIAVVAVAGAGVLYTVTRPAAPIMIASDPTAPALQGSGYLYGDPNAAITISEFADFECPGCAQFSVLTTPDVKARIVDAGLANFRFYDFPLNIHPNTMAAHLAAACANDQEQFWAMHDRIFQGQYDWNSQATGNPRKILATYAEGLGLDMAAWNSCFDEQKHVSKIEANRNVGIKLGVGSTPTIQVGDRLYPGGLSGDQLKLIVDSMYAALPAGDSQ